MCVSAGCGVVGLRRPPLFNSLLSFFTTFFEMRVAGSCYQPLNPYYFLFSAALLRPRYLPLPFATARTDALELGLAAVRLMWLVVGASWMKQFLVPCDRLLLVACCPTAVADWRPEPGPRLIPPAALRPAALPSSMLRRLPG